jgi:hypothetical protein
MRDRRLRDRARPARVIAAQAFASIYLTGVIWIVQLVHYPAFALVEDTSFTSFHARHSRMMTWLVGPIMLAELGTAAWLARGLDARWLLNLASVLVPFGATFLLSVPCHDRLAAGRDPLLVARLVRTNWVRTVAWSARAVVYFFLMNESMGNA